MAVVSLVLIAVVVACGGWAYWSARASLAQLDGQAVVRGLSASVEVDRDAAGVPTIRALSRLDCFRALGFVHAQDRFFQMDLARRSTAGELAELFGRKAVALDRSNRLHRFRERADSRLPELPAWQQEALEAYSAGVNAGLEALGEVPPEYLAFRAEPRPWSPRDTILVAYSMYLNLAMDLEGRREIDRGLLRETYPPALVDFLYPPRTSWEAPLAGDLPPPPPLPGPEVIDLRREPLSELAAADFDVAEDYSGSNSWAVSGARSTSGAALLAVDMHLALRVPNTWYRARLVYPEADITGLTLPGAPGVVVGSNGRLAWGFTNSGHDTSDVVLLPPDGMKSGAYLTPDGPRSIERRQETIDVRGEAPQTIETSWTVWGPIVGVDSLGRGRVWRWLGYEPDAVNFDLLRMAEAASVDEALAIAPDVHLPPQNVVLADSSGHVAWTLLGGIPRRIGDDGRFPLTGRSSWAGFLGADERPAVVDPPDGLIWTANNRVLGGAWFDKLGGPPISGARARLIRDALGKLDRANEADMLAIQLDSSARYFEDWKNVLLNTLDDAALDRSPQRKELRGLLESTWTGQASIDSVAYRIVRAFRAELAERAFPPLTARARKIDPEVSLSRSRFWDAPLRRMAREQPSNLLPAAYESWQALLLAAADAVPARIGGAPLKARTWGERNTLAMRHPLSGAAPILAPWLDMPPVELPGDDYSPRAQQPSRGASERIVVSPGHEGDAIFEMPGGQSGHFLSPYYRAGHEAWVQGEATPLLPGEAAHTLVLEPR